MNLPDLVALFAFNVNPLEIVLRGSVMYWVLFLVFRFVRHRDGGSIGIADVLLLVLIADGSQNAMSGAYDSIAEGCLLVATIAGWNCGLDWAGYHFQLVRKFAEPAPLLLVTRGRMLRKSMRRELIIAQELWAKLRERGVRDLNKVAAAFMESSGEISVLRPREARGES